MSKIIRLESKNVKRLSAVEITPDGSIVVIGGNNGQGKTSVLDSIAFALGGTAGIQSEPIRKGESRAKVVVETEELIVTREFTPKGTFLKVVGRDGKTLPKPQSVIDDLIGKLSFDPLAFSRMKPAEQSGVLRDLLGISTDEIDAERKTLYEERTHTNRELKTATAARDETPKVPCAATEEVSVADLTKQIREAEDHNRRLCSAEDHYDEGNEAIEAIEKKVAAMKREIELAEADIASRRENQKASLGAIKALGPPADTSTLIEQIEDVENTNAAVRQNAKHAELSKRADDLHAASTKLSNDIARLDDQKANLLSNVEYPVPGMAMGDDGTVLLDGVPFDQGSAAQQLRASVAIGLAMNPKLRVMLVRDGSLLDSDSMKLLAELAIESDAQIWVERVGSGDEGAVLIEDGVVADPVSMKV